MSTPITETRLFKPITIGKSSLKHRIVMAPLTRYRNDHENVPLPIMEQYYGDRASAPGTLVISEATAVTAGEVGRDCGPGFYKEEQVEGWRKIIAGVHQHGSVWFQQLWGMGRACEPDYVRSRGFEYHSSSATRMDGVDETPKAMTEEEIQQFIADFVAAAKNVIRAGGDGVEIHGAHGYLLDQFLSDNVNHRTDRWGGSIENRSRLILEVVKQVTAAIGSDRVALRLSPYAGFQQATKSDVVGQYTYLLNELKKLPPLAYLSLVEATGDPGVLLLGDKEINQGKTLDFMLELWDNYTTVMVAGGYRAETASSVLESHYGKWNVIVGFGRYFISNPDLVYRFRHGLALTKYDRSTFYVDMANEGYNTYPFSEEFLKEHGN